MGRVMSLLMFGSVSLVPISIAMAGILVEISLDGVLLVAGLGMAVLALSTLSCREVSADGPRCRSSTKGTRRRGARQPRSRRPLLAG